MRKIPFRQINLDFHTSPLIPDVGTEFDAGEFAQTMADAHVESVNIFSKCHHGYTYYPSKVTPMHPSLHFDMLGQMIEALHDKNIRCPVYLSVGWDDYAATIHPEWIQLDEHGKQVGREPYRAEGEGWKWMCLNNGYLDYLSTQVAEVLEYKPDGMFFDIVQYHETGCSCAFCVGSMREKGYDATNVDDRRKHSDEVLRHAMNRLSKQVWEAMPDATIYYNGRQHIDERPWHSLRRELDSVSHLEIESLPSGTWGYNHFPLHVRFDRNLGKELVGMNGRFHKSWADFGGMKNRAAFEFECFNMLSSGAKISVGDQLHPRGRLDPATYQLIGEVFAQIKAKQPWCEGAVPVSEIALMAVNDGTIGRAQRAVVKTLDAAAQMLLESGYQFDVVDWEEPLDKYRLVVLPDIVRLDEDRAGRIQAYLDKGGHVLMTGKSGLWDARDAFAIPFSAHCEGESAFTATYLRVGEPLSKGLAPMDYVSYNRGMNVIAGEGSTVLAQVVEPYFERQWDHYMSHQQTPPDKLSPYAGAILEGNIIYFSDPLFTEYKENGNLVYKTLIQNAIARLLGHTLVESNLPSTARVTVCDQPGRRVVHLLHYPYERRAQIDIIEDIIPLYDIDLRVAVERPPKKAYLAPSEQSVDFTYDNGVVALKVGCLKGHEMLVLEG